MLSTLSQHAGEELLLLQLLMIRHKIDIDRLEEQGNGDC